MRACLPLVLTVFLLAAPAAASAQAGFQPVKPAQAGGAEQSQPAPGEEVSPELEVRLNRDFLSVSAKGASFGDVIGAIANAVGFEADISRDVYDKKITTRFRDVGLQRGIQRLLSLVTQKTYSIYYDKQGSIKRLEVYGNLNNDRDKAGSGLPSRAPVPAGQVGPAQQHPPLTVIEQERAPAPGSKRAPGEADEGPRYEPSGIYIRMVPPAAPEGVEGTDAVEEPPVTEEPPPADDTAETEVIPEEWVLPDDNQLLDAPLLPGSPPVYIPPTE